MKPAGERSVEIEFCVPCDLRSEAVAAVRELLAEWVFQIKELRLVPGTGGRFEVTVDGVLVFSKAALGRTPEPGELAELFGRLPTTAASDSQA